MKKKKYLRNPFPLHMIEPICPICKKKIYISCADQWVYKKVEGIKRVYYCSWHCLQESRKEIKPKRTEQNVFGRTVKLKEKKGPDYEY